MAVKQILNITEFTRGNEASWQQMTVPIPDGVVVVSIDEGRFKIGDGIALYASLPTLFTFADLENVKEGFGLFFDAAFDGVATDNEIVFISNGKYLPSGTTISGVLARLTTLETENAQQSIDFKALMDLMLKVDALSIGNGANDNMVVITDQKYMDSGTTQADIVTTASAQNVTVPGPHLESVKWYTDPNFTVEVDKCDLKDQNRYFVKLIGFHDDTNAPVFDLTTEQAGIAIIAGIGYWEVVIDGLVPAGVSKVPAVVYASIDDGTGNAKGIKPVRMLVEEAKMLVSVYGGAGADIYRNTTIDSAGNAICAGYTNSEGAGDIDALVVKFDASLNILARKVYGGAVDDYFLGVITDASGNIICAGRTSSEGAGSYDALVVKFDASLNILAKKVYGGTGDDQFRGVTTDSAGNVICAGWAASEGAGYYDALVVKFDASLNILARKVYGGAVDDYFYGAATDASGNVICVGHTSSEGAGSADALVVKFDASLNILARKVYGGAGSDAFYGAATDASGDIFCVGYTASEGAGLNDTLIVKFDTSLNILTRKIYGGAGDDLFYNVTTDSAGNIICAGVTTSEGAGLNDTLIVKFDASLNILASKVYGGTGGEALYGVTTDTFGNIICAGYTGSEGAGGNDGLIVKFPSDIPSGTFVSAVLTGLTLTDSALTLADSALTLADSALTLADSALTLADSALTLIDSTITQEIDTIG